VVQSLTMAVDNAVLAELDAAGAECGFKMDFPGISANCEATSQTDGILITAVHWCVPGANQYRLNVQEAFGLTAIAGKA